MGKILDFSRVLFFYANVFEQKVSYFSPYIERLNFFVNGLDG